MSRYFQPGCGREAAQYAAELRASLGITGPIATQADFTGGETAFEEPMQMYPSFEGGWWVNQARCQFWRHGEPDCDEPAVALGPYCAKHAPSPA